MMSKKGLSHLEFVISFVIFIGFILFAFVFFNPLQSQRTLKSTLDYAWLEVSEEAKGKIETYSFNLLAVPANANIQVNIPDIPLNYNVSVEDINGNILPTFRDSNGYIYFNKDDEKFFIMRYSPEFLNGIPITSYIQVGNNDYVISSSEIEDIYFERLFLELNQTYFSDYDNLKQKLNLPNRMEFGFVVKFEDSEIRALNEIPSDVEVLAKNDRIEIIRNSGKRGYAEVSVIVW